MHIHHKDRDPMNNSESNLERLCPKCHAKEHAKDMKVCVVCKKPRRSASFCEEHYWMALNGDF